jgi:hypothetical protein
MMISIPANSSPRSGALLHRINAALSKPGSPLSSQGIAPQLIVEAWTAADLGLVISEAFHDSDDLHGPDWSDVARKVADAMGFALQPAPVGAGRS